MNEIFGFFFTLGGIMGYLAMFAHSIKFDQDKRLSLFIFLGGSLMAYFLEFTLVHLIGAYAYTSLPLQIWEIPLVIPLGWVVTFYGLSLISKDLLEFHGKETGKINLSVLSFLLAILFGMGIEIMARQLGFWIFFFNTIKFAGIPVIVTLAWGFSVMFFVFGMEQYKSLPKHWPIILLAVQIANTLVAIILMQFTTLALL